METKNETQKKSRRRMGNTKWKLFKVALDLFSTRGYAHVGVREIAEELNIKAASIYNHFPSKDAFLEEIFKYFYENYNAKQIATRDLVAMIPTKSPQEIFSLLLLPYGGEAAYDTMRKVLSVALMEHGNDKRAAEIVSEVFFITTEKISLTLSRMLELDMIEPVDIGLFTSVYISTSLSATLLLGGRHAITYERWKAGRMLLLSLIRKRGQDEGSVTK